MKKVIAVMLTILTALSLAVPAFSAEDFPYERGSFGTEEFRIPACYTLKDGSIVFSADMRNTAGKDSPENIDTLTAVLKGGEFEAATANRFDDAPDGVSCVDSASYIDTALLQSDKTGRVFLLATAYPTGTGILNGVKGSGYKEGKLILTDRNGEEYTAGEFKNGFAAIEGAEEYTVDEDFLIYKNGEPLYTNRKITGEKIRQSVFYDGSDFCVKKTSYLILKYSDDNGKSWSKPMMLNTLKREDETFMGVCPGRGLCAEYEGRERLYFCVYNSYKGREKSSVIYSDDNGETWNRGEDVKTSFLSGKASESQLIACPGGRIRIFARNKSKFVTTAVSDDGGVTFTKLKADTDLFCTKNCMVSFITTSKVIDGRKVVLGSFPSHGKKRENGVIISGLMNTDGSIEWLERYHINEGWFAYSCLTETADGHILCFYEDEPSHLKAEYFTIDEKGNISARDRENVEFEEKESLFTVFLKFINRHIVF